MRGHKKFGKTGFFSPNHTSISHVKWSTKNSCFRLNALLYLVFWSLEKQFIASMIQAKCKILIEIGTFKSPFFENVGFWKIPFQKVLKRGPKILDVKGYPFEPKISRCLFLLIYLTKVLKKGSPKIGGLTLNPLRPHMSKKTSIFEDFWQFFFHFSKIDIFD